MGCLGTLIVVVVIVGFVALLLAYPKQTLITVAAIVVIAGLVIFSILQNDRERSRKAEELKKKRERSVLVVVSYSPATCGQANPMSVTVRNGWSETLTAVSIYLQAYRPGYSTDLLQGSYESFKWDRILPPGQSATLCYAIPRTIAQFPSYPPQTLEFRVGDKLLTFQ